MPPPIHPSPTTSLNTASLHAAALHNATMPVRRPAFVGPLPPRAALTVGTAATSPRRPPARRRPAPSKPRRTRPATVPSHDAFQDFSRELGEHSLLTPPEERALLLKVRPLRVHERVRADLASELRAPPTDAQLAAALGVSPPRLRRERRKALRARDALVHANLRLVVRVARRVHKTAGAAAGGAAGAGVSLTDLVQEGSLALIRAAEKFDLQRGERFAPYACRAIWSRCRRAMTPASCIVSLPERLRVAAGKLGRFRAEFERENGRRPSEEAEAAVTAGEPLRLVRGAERHLRGGVFLDAPVGDGCGLDMLRWEGKLPQEVLEREEVRRRVKEACYRRLRRRDADILVMRFGLEDGKPVLGREVAKRVGVSAPRVTQIVLQALETLRVQEPRLADLIHDL